MNVKLLTQIKFSVASAGKAAKFIPMLVLLSVFSAVSLAQAPVNDNACQAIVLTPGATCVYQTFTNLNATGSTGVSVPACASYSPNDVWFKVTVPAGGALTFDTQEGGMTDGGMAIYRGNNCVAVSLVPGACDDNSSTNPNMPKLTVTGLTVGSSVYARVWSKGSTPTGTFGICVTIPVPAPVNDEPCNAIELTPGATCNFQTFTNESASNSTGVPAPVCAGFLGGDVWFKAVVPAIGALIFDTQEGVMLDGGMAVYSGTDCNNLTFLDCDDNSGTGNMPKLTVAGLNPGDTVWVRIWENGNNNNGTFGICASLPPPPPANDGPCTAIELTVDTACNFQTFTTENALGTSTVPDPGCAGYAGADVWFTAVVPAGGAISFDSEAGVITDGGMAVYSGNCNNLNLLGCDDDAGTGNMPKLTFGGLTPGDTVWVRFWENGGNNNGTFGICAKIPPPAPSNDDPCNAIEIIPSTDCNYQTFTNENATGSFGVPDPGCANYVGGDVWFKVVVPAGGAMIFDSQTGVITDGGMAVYRGTCNNLTLVDCDDDASANGNMPRLDLGGLTPGDTLWVRFWEYNGDNNGTFGICIKIPPPPPANDNPCTSFNLVADTVCNYQTFTNESSTGTTGVPAPGCAGYSGGDVWFNTIVPAGGQLVIDTHDGVMTDGGMAAYSGHCDALTLVACDDNSSPNANMPKLILQNLTPGDTIWIRVWENGNNNNGTFGICVKIPPPPPVNDDPCNAVLLSVDSLCNYQTFTNESATATQGVPAPGCAGYSGGDVWFTAVVPAGGAINFDTQTGEMLDGGMAAYTGTCGNLTLLNCDDNASANGNMPRLALVGLTPGDTIYIRIWENGNNNNGTFGICASVPPPAPAYDDPCNAVEIVASTSCSYQTFTNESALGTVGVPAPGCAGYSGGDVWFKTVVPAGGALTFDTQEGVMLDGGMAVYSGTCNSLTLLNCDDNSSPNGLMPKLTVGNLTPGDTVWVRVWENGNNNNGTFGICATIPPPPPTNDDPCNSINLIPDSTCNFQTFTNFNATSSFGIPAPGCANYQGGDVWFNVVVPSGGALIFDSQTGVITDGGMAVYSGTCNNLTLVDCDDDGSSNGLMPYLSVGGFTPGDTLWVRFWEYGNDNNGEFGICVKLPPPGPVNDDPCGAIELPVTANCSYQTFTNESAFGTGAVPAPGCGGYQGGDVWFKAVVPAGGAISFDTQAGVVTDGAMAVYTGTCDNLTLAQCDDDAGTGNMPKMTIGGLNVGDTVWIRFWENGNNNNGTFGICATIPPPPPANDNPCGAIDLVATDSCNYQTFSNQSSYGTAGIPAPGCGDYQGSDVWFKITAPAAGALNINTQAGTIVDAAMAIYSADSCNGAMTLIACDDNASSNPNMPYITATGLTPGSTVWVRVWSNGGAASAGTFGICAVIPPLQPATFSFACARDTSFNCGGGDSCFTLTAIIPDIHALTDRYAINPLSSSGVGCFNPYNDPGNEGPSTDIVRDDVYSDVINLPFTFPFFGTNYNALVASTNGYVSFDATLANAFSHWNIINGAAPQNLPSTFYDRALIMGPYHDLDPFYNTSPTQRIKYNVTGQAPHRRWILSFYKVPLFTNAGGGCDTLINNTHQIVLYEGTGVVEVFIFDMQNCPGWNQGRAMVGMQDFSRTRAIMAPGRRATDAPWGHLGMNESWRFVPIGGPSLFKRVELFDTSGNFLATGHTSFLDSASLKVDFTNLCALNRLPAGYNTLLVRAVYQKFNDPNAEEIGADTVRIFLPNLKVNFDVTDARCADTVGSVSVHVINGVPPLQFSADSGITWQSDSVFTNLAAGSYYIKVRDNAGCARDTIVDISHAAVVTAAFAVNNAACNGGNGTVDITATGTSPIKYSSDGGATYQYDSSFQLPAGTYNFHVEDTVGCAMDTTITITEPAAMTILYNTANAHCNGGTDGSISVMPSGGSTPYTYSFDSGAYDTTSSATFGAGDHLVSVKDANGCTKDTTITLTEPDPIFTPAVVTNVNCAGGNNGGIVISPVGGAVPYDYSVDGGATYQAGTSLSNLTGGVYNITIRDGNGCTKDTTITITEPAAITVTAAVTAPTCNGGTDGQVVITAGGGTGTYEYSSDGGATYQAGNSFTVAAGTFSIRIRDINGCTKDTSITVADPAAIVPNITVADASCSSNNGQVSASPTGGTGTYTYSIDGTNFQPGSSFQVAPGNYSITVRDANGCAVTAPAIVGLTFDLYIQGAPDAVICDNGRVKLNTTSNGQTYSWTPAASLDDATIASPFASPSVTTDYILTATLGNCTLKDTVRIVVTAAPTVFAGDDVQVIKGGDAQLGATVTNTANYNWSPTTYLNNPNSLSPVSVMPQQTTTYTLTVYNAEGCSASDSVTVVVLPYCIKVKNAFTPNGDGVNDTWSVYDQYDCLTNVRVQVFNRYGSKVFESTNYRNDWKGTYGGQSLPDATYYYVIDYTLITGRVYQVRGDVTILR